MHDYKRLDRVEEGSSLVEHAGGLVDLPDGVEVALRPLELEEVPEEQLVARQGLLADDDGQRPVHLPIPQRPFHWLQGAADRAARLTASMQCEGCN